MARIFVLIFIACLFLGCKSNKSSNLTMDHKYTNKLIDESSPYLLQHAHNPVNWYPWGEEALSKAKKEDKIVIISIGYAACHWCHVMEHESFEDSTVAKMMNDNFVCIKVDREERPDVDDIYMTACNLVSGSGGWPLNAFALADGRPFWAGTYFPKDKWMDIMEQFIELKKENPDRLIESANKITEGVQSVDAIEIQTNDIDYTIPNLDKITSTFIGLIDFEDGGRKGEPKFPMPNNYEYLLKYNYLTGNEKALEAVTTTLDKMALGGIYDQLGGGFARYSVDAYWLAPHFEKMTYDNAQLVSLYSQAYRKTKNPLYKTVVDQTLEYTKREMTSPENGFYSSLDADSEGEEGKFYTWSKDEVDSLLVDETINSLFNEYYNVKKIGNWEHTNILHITESLEKVAKKHKLSTADAGEKLANAKSILFKHRAKRIRPGLDDKILTSWNALMIKGYIDAYLAFDNPDYLQSAINNANFLVDKQLQNDNRLNRNYKDGKSSINAFLDDYAVTIDAFVFLYQATFDEKWLYKADDILSYVKEHFFNSETAMFDYTSKLDPPLVAKKAEYTDNVIPASNSIMARNLYNLGTLLYKPEYQSMSKQMLKNMTAQIETSAMPSFYSNWLQLYLDNTFAPYEIAIIGSDSQKKKLQLTKNYLGNALLLGGNSEGSLALLKDKMMEGETTIYVCQNKVCKIPTTDIEKAFELAKP